MSPVATLLATTTPNILGITLTTTSIPIAFILTLGTIALLVGIYRAYTEDPKGINPDTLKRILTTIRRTTTFTVGASILTYLLTTGITLYTEITEFIAHSWNNVGGLLGPQATVVGASLGLTAAIITVIVNHRLAKRRAREEWQRQSIFGLLDATDDILIDYQKQFTHTIRQMNRLNAADSGSDATNATGHTRALEKAHDAYTDLQHIQNRFRSNIGRISMIYPKNIYFRGSTMDGFDKILGKITYNFETALGISNIDEIAVDALGPVMRTASSAGSPGDAGSGAQPVFDQDTTTKLLYKLTEAFDVISYSTKELITTDATGNLAYKIMGLITMLGLSSHTDEEPHHDTPARKDIHDILADTTPIKIQTTRRLPGGA